MRWVGNWVNSIYCGAWDLCGSPFGLWVTDAPSETAFPTDLTKGSLFDLVLGLLNLLDASLPWLYRYIEPNAVSAEFKIRVELRIAGSICIIHRSSRFLEFRMNSVVPITSRVAGKVIPGPVAVFRGFRNIVSKCGEPPVQSDSSLIWSWVWATVWRKRRNHLANSWAPITPYSSPYNAPRSNYTREGEIEKAE